MASGRTISANFLTEKDKKIIALCEHVTNVIYDCIPKECDKKEYMKEYGKVHATRDAGLGRGAAKLQRDALCTRGKTNKAPFSNRNFRWHPLVVSAEKVDYAKSIERIEVNEEAAELVFVVIENGAEVKYTADKVHEMKERYVATSEHWQPHVEILKSWGDIEWTQNSCVIPALEACNWQDAVETYAVLGISIAVSQFGANYSNLFPRVQQILAEQEIDSNVHIPSECFPIDKAEYTLCPLSKKPTNMPLTYRHEEREDTWQPNWRASKRDEGDDSTLQIMHLNPLVEKEMRHRADNVRYGFRWCNVAMTDHSLDETLDFMRDIVKAHGIKD